MIIISIKQGRKNMRDIKSLSWRSYRVKKAKLGILHYKNKDWQHLMFACWPFEILEEWETCAVGRGVPSPLASRPHQYVKPAKPSAS